MSMYKYVRELWKIPKAELKEINKQRLIKWKKEETTIRIDRPTRIDRARSLGYRAKPGFIIVRQRLKRGKRQKPKIRKGRRPKHFTRRKDLRVSYQLIAEQRAQRKYVNCTVLNSYHVGQDSQYYWYEVILVDRTHPQIISDPKINWICSKKGRAARGLTSSARKSRSLTKKGKGTEKMRPSLRAHQRKAR